jgi:hypothetical protein
VHNALPPSPVFVNIGTIVFREQSPMPTFITAFHFTTLTLVSSLSQSASV